MSDLVAGYAYDIFISYRHNDNLDGWVTDFVENLEKELRSTLKESVTIYFDKNPHDGLLETHNVDKSLEGKLKSLIFIPIISQTYCDTKSFAWQHEFVAFNKLAKVDQFGRDVKLGNGNVASRILPIKIHDLDDEDKALLEKEIEGSLRTIEFIFKSAGVNRPLRANEDHPQDNLNKTYYRDQVNKVANAIKDIIRSLRDPKRQVSQSKLVTSTRTGSSTGPGRQVGIGLGALAIICLFITAWYFMKPSPGNKLTAELGIAVLPFQNLSDDKDQEYFNDGLTEDITDRLTKIKELRVISRTSVTRYKDNPPPIPQIGKELNVSYILEGSARRQGNRLKIVAQLIRASTADHIWSETIERDASDIFEIQAEIATKIARYLKISLSVNEQGELADIPTRSMEAYDLYIRGKADSSLKSAANDRRISNFRRATMLDPEFAEAYGELARGLGQKQRLYGNGQIWLDSALIYAARAIQLKPTYAGGYQVMGLCYSAKGEWEIAKGYMLKSHSLQPGLGVGSLSSYMLRRHKLDSAMLYNFEGLRYSPASPWTFIVIADTFIALGMYDSAMNAYEKAISLNQEFTAYRHRKAEVLIRMRQYDQAIDYAKKSPIAVDTTKRVLSNTNFAIARAYAFKGDWEKVILHLDQCGYSEHELMALALLKTGNQAKAQKIIKIKKEEFTKTNDQVELARVAILENDLTMAAKILDAAYSDYKLTSLPFGLDPFYEELNNIKEYTDLKVRIDAERKAALASIQAMHLR